MTPVCLVCNDSELLPQATAIAGRLDIPQFKQSPAEAELVLELSITGLKLLRPYDKSVGALQVDFNDGAPSMVAERGKPLPKPLV